MPVILYHAGFSSFSGGYVGVDVFFVISGYLITTIILAELEAGNFSIVNFYERRMRRILPALFFIMFASLPFAGLLLYPHDMEDFSKSLTAVSLFSSNIYFWRTSGYFFTANELKPLIHTWSLSVEEQYYLLFPVFLVLTWRLGKRWIVSLLAVAFLISLVLAQWASQASPAANFYLLPTRGWELLLGGFVAFYLTYHLNPHPRKEVNEFGSMLGFCLIVYSVFIFDRNTPFPSLYALAPTVGAGLVILYSTQNTFIGRILGNRIFVGLGLVSYSAYLLHQPLFAFIRYNSVREPNNFLLIAESILVFVLAYFSWRFVETPFRCKEKFGRKLIFLYSSIGSVTIIALGMWGNYTDGFKEIRLTDGNRNLLAQFEKPKFYRCFTDIGINGRSSVEITDLCQIGDKAAKPSFVVYGDSHTVSLSTAFDEAAKVQGVSGLLVATSSCPPLSGITPIRRDRTRELCLSVNRLMPKLVSEMGINKVFLVGRWTYYTNGGLDHTRMFIGKELDGVHTEETSTQAFVAGVRNTLASYLAVGVRPYFVFQAPNQKIDSQRVYRFRGGVTDEELVAASVTISEHRLYQKVPNDILRAFVPNTHLVDLTDAICSEGVCPIGTSTASNYIDDDHLSQIGASKLIRIFIPLL